MNQTYQDYLKETVLQACEEIKSNIDIIIPNSYIHGLDIVIRIDYDSRPEIIINKNYSIDIPRPQ